MADSLDEARRLMDVASMAVGDFPPDDRTDALRGLLDLISHKLRAPVHNRVAKGRHVSAPEAEPSLGAPEASVLMPQWPRGSFDHRERDAGDEPEIENEHGAEDDTGEPSLGAPEATDQTRWAQGGRRDHED